MASFDILMPKYVFSRVLVFLVFRWPFFIAVNILVIVVTLFSLAFFRLCNMSHDCSYLCIHLRFIENGYKLATDGNKMTLSNFDPISIWIWLSFIHIHYTYTNCTSTLKYLLIKRLLYMSLNFLSYRKHLILV